MVDDLDDLRVVDRGGSSATLLVSTTTTSSFAETSSMIWGVSKPQRCSTNAASVFGSPRSRASAGLSSFSERYHAQISAEPVESVSGALWPKTRMVMGMRLWDERSLRAPYRRGGGRR